MARASKTRCIGILTSGGDCPGLNAAIRGVAKAAQGVFGMKTIGILDGFRGLVENRTIRLDDRAVSGILTHGGTILGTSRDKPHKMPIGGKTFDMTAAAVENYRRLSLDCLVCLGGGGTQKNALRLREAGLNVLTLPKTIDNDVAGTDVTFGYDTARQIAVDAIDRLHTTATSHHRIILCEIMGHNAGWLTLSAGVAGGADVILLPEIPYDLDAVAEYLFERRRTGKRFSIIAVAEGARSIQEAETQADAEEGKPGKKAKSGNKAKASKKKARGSKPDANGDDTGLHLFAEPVVNRIARELQRLTSTDVRVTSLGHVQRGGIPTAFDRMLCTRLGAKAAELLADGVYNVMVGFCSERCVPVPLEEVAGKRKVIPADHPMIRSARLVGTCMGDR